MGREIKFKVWDKEKQEMYFTDMSDNIEASNSIMECRIGLDEMGWYVAVRGFNEEEFTEIKDFELLQYTGLKDENGKEICEGDIVRITTKYYNNCSRKKLEKVETEVMLVVFEYWTFGLKGKDGITPFIWQMSLDHIIEVVGNIYKNPELLEVVE